MSDVAAAEPVNDGEDKKFFGHPRGLSTLFFTELWERFSYYGMRAFLVLYIATAASKGGLGESKATAGIIYGLYTALVYLLSLPGGWVADRFLGQRKAVLYGGIIIMCGHITLAIPAEHASFYPGLVLIILGTGLLKPNVSTIVGQLYSKEDPRRDAGYTIYYMGINIGALAAPLVCGWLAQSDTFRDFLADWGVDPNMAWHFGFAAAAVGMAVGLVQYMYGWRFMGDAGLHPSRPEPGASRTSLPPAAVTVIGIGLAAIVAFSVWRLMAGGINEETIADSFGVGLGVISILVFVVLIRWVARDADERRRVWAMAVLFVGCMAFFGLFEQAGSTLNFFAKEKTENSLLGFDFPSTWFQSVNPVYVILLAPVFAALWIKLARRNREPSAVMKFAIGMVLIGVSFAVLLPAVLGPIASGDKASPGFLLSLYLFATAAEMCISPVGLSTMNKLAPDRLAGFVMGIWFLATSVGNYIAGRAEHEVGSLAEWLDLGPAGLFYLLIAFSLIVALGLFLLAGPVKRMLATQDSVDLPKAVAREKS